MNYFYLYFIIGYYFYSIIGLIIDIFTIDNRINSMNIFSVKKKSAFNQQKNTKNAFFLSYFISYICRSGHEFFSGMNFKTSCHQKLSSTSKFMFLHLKSKFPDHLIG